MSSFHFVEQIKQHALAIISIVIAIIALSYNTWRDEETEKNRNIRQAGFELIKDLGQLQLVVNYSHYKSDSPASDPMMGWGYVALISDIGQLLPSPIPERTDAITEVWKNNWDKIKTDQQAVEEISNQIDAAREAVLTAIRNLH